MGITIISFLLSICRGGLAVLIGVTEYLIPAVFHTIVTLSAPAGHLPLEGKAAIREYHLLNRRRSRPCESIRSPSTVIPSEAEGSLLHCRHMHTCPLTQMSPWCFLFRLSLTHGLPVCKKDPSTSVGMTGGRRVISHSLSHRCVDPFCAFGAGRLASQEGALMGRLGASLD